MAKRTASRSDLEVRIGALASSLETAEARLRDATQREVALRRQLDEARDAIRQWRDLFAPGLHRLLSTSDAYVDGVSRVTMEVGNTLAFIKSVQAPKTGG